MKTETKTPKAGEWWHFNGVRIRIVGVLLNGRLVCEYKDGSTLILTQGTFWHHEPRCDSFDWQEPKPVDPGEGWALLPKGAMLEKGDEFDAGGTWEKTCYPGNKSIAGLTYRRKVNPPSPEFCVSCDVHSVVPGTETCGLCAGYVSLEGTKVGTVKITPVESPDDWVEITDPDHLLRFGIDQFVVKGDEYGDWKEYLPLSKCAKYYVRDFRDVRCKRKDIPSPAQAVKRVPVRLWVHSDSRNDERYNVFVKLTPPAESNLYREIMHDAYGFYVEGEE